MKISILTPSYNSGKYLERAIKSVINQEYKNWEHIICDGGSSDNTLDIIKKYKHLKWRSEKDNGQSDAMNKAFKMSEGDIIVYLNADDEFQENIFKRVMGYFKNHPHAEFIYGDLLRILPDGNQVKDTASIDLLEILNYWPCRFPLNSTCYFYKRNVQLKVGDFPVNNHYTMDYWFLLRVYKAYIIHYIPLIFGKFYYFDNKSTNILNVKNSLKSTRNQFLKENPNIAITYFFYGKIINPIVKIFKKIQHRIRSWVNP